MLQNQVRKKTTCLKQYYHFHVAKSNKKENNLFKTISLPVIPFSFYKYHTLDKQEASL